MSLDTYQPRRTSALAYQNATRHDRSHSRSQKHLVVVIPPSDLPLDQGHLGNVLSTGPRHRLSHGILMPLLPSMYGQLNAIAREYNFPSIVGLCLYLHMNENGMKMTPRISDDAWHYLFGHLFDGRPPSTGQLPIGGSIEFDIDLNKARWFDAWVSGPLRSSDPVFLPGVTHEAHWRGESQTLNVDEQPHEDQWVASQSRPETLRHLPKKLSLVDRLDLHGVHKSQDYPDSSLTHGTYASSPILQPAIPKVAETDLEHRVNSWMATTDLCPVSLAETYQPAPDVGVSAGGIMDEYALERNFQQSVGIDDFLWSVPPVAPPSPVMQSQTASSRPSSLRLDRPINPTVPLFPTTATSWGPTDDEWHSDVSSATRLPSPDMGERIVEDAAAPRPRPVWGHSFGWRSAMTWKQVYPFSVTPTINTIQVQLQDPSGLVPQYPDLVIYPPSRPSPQSVWGSSFGWQGTATWRMVYPYSMVTAQSTSPTRLFGAGGLQPKYPNLCVYPRVYPHLDIYPTCTSEEDISQPVSVMLSESNTLLTCYPSLVIYPAVYPHLDIYPPAVENVETKGSDQVGTDGNLRGCVSISYPNLVIYPAVYPHFDLYPNALQVIEMPKRVGAMPLNGCPTPKHHGMSIYPGVYPRNTGIQASSVAWGMSSGWLTGKTWLQVYPLHTAGSLTTTTQRTDDQNKSISRLGNEVSVISVTVDREHAVWGSSFGWKTAMTWRAVWPTPCSRTPPVAITKAEESRLIKESNYPNLVIYPAVYPHFDLYPAVGGAFVEHEKGESNLRHRRVERWRARTAAQVGLAELLANNHVWEVDEPLRLDLTDYAWSPTSAGPGTSFVEVLDTPSIPESVHIDRRVRGSVLRTPSTATTWGPPDDDWYSEIESIERLPSPDLGQRTFDDTDPYQPWHMVWPFFRDASQVKPSPSVPEQSAFISEYPYLVVYPPAPSQFEHYPTSIFKNLVFVNPSVYPALDIYPAVYPHFNIYPGIDLQLEVLDKESPSVQHEQVEVRLATLYPNFDIYHACYPYNLEIYPIINAPKSTQVPIEASRGYPWLVIYPPVYPYVIPYPSVSAETSQPPEPEQMAVNVNLPVCYPSLDLYPACYPWSLDSIYPAVTVSVDDCSVAVEPQYPYICIYSPVYPFVQPYCSAPGALDESRYESAKAFLALSELKQIDQESVLYPHFNLYPPIMPEGRMVQDVNVGDLAAPTHITPRKQRKTHMELHAAVFQSLGMGPARGSKTHLQLHVEVFQDGGIVWTPSGYMQDLSSMISVPKAQQHRPSRDDSTPSTSSLGKRGLGDPPQPPPVVSSTPTPHVSSPTRTSSHVRTTSVRLSQSVKSMMPRGQRRNSSATPGSPLPDDHKERAKGLQFLSSVDRWKAVPHTNTSELQTRTPRRSASKDSLVLQRARAYEQLTAANLSSVSKGMHSLGASDD